MTMQLHHLPLLLATVGVALSGCAAERAPVPTATPASVGVLTWHSQGGTDTSPAFQVLGGRRYSVAWLGNSCPVGVTVSIDPIGRDWDLVADARTRDPKGSWGGELPSDLPPGRYHLNTFARCSFDLYVTRAP